jgi:hypothetical protein
MYFPVQGILYNSYSLLELDNDENRPDRVVELTIWLSSPDIVKICRPLIAKQRPLLGKNLIAVNRTLANHRL